MPSHLAVVSREHVAKRLCRIVGLWRKGGGGGGGGVFIGTWKCCSVRSGSC